MIVTGHRDAGIAVHVESCAPLSMVRAGSALLAIGDRLVVVGDDAHAVVWVDPATGATRQEALDGDGRALPKAEKPDFEAAAVDHAGNVWLFGSGSLPSRRRVARLGGETYDAAALFEALEASLGGTPNVEGAIFIGTTLRLFHRAVGDAPDEWFDILDFPERPRVVAAHELRLGSLSGVALHVTDAALTTSGDVAFLAAAEATEDPVLDAAVAGSVLGVIAGTEARWTPLTDEKAEGLVLDGDGGWFVTDSDDAESSARLCRFRVCW